MTGTAVVPVQATSVGATLFNGATPEEVILAATDVANRFSSVVKEQHLFQAIGGRQHVLIEGWQTVGTLVGVFAVKDEGVTQLSWPPVAPLREQPQDPGPEPPRSSPQWPTWKDANSQLASWRMHRDLLAARERGLGFGFTASYVAVKGGSPIGWGEGRCTRTEGKWVNRDDYALESMAQTRGQSRALAAPLRFIVKLAGYATTPAEEYDPEPEPNRAAPAPPVTLDNAGEEAVVEALEATWPEVDAVKFMVKLEKRFGTGVPVIAGDALRAWAWFVASQRERPAPEEGQIVNGEPVEQADE